MLNTFDEVEVDIVEDEVLGRVELGWIVVNCVALNDTNVVKSKSTVEGEGTGLTVV